MWILFPFLLLAGDVALHAAWPLFSIASFKIEELREVLGAVPARDFLSGEFLFFFFGEGNVFGVNRINLCHYFKLLPPRTPSPHQKRQTVASAAA